MARGGAVVVTGASTGIGRATALALDAAGMRVFAGVRRQEDADDLRRERPGITPLLFDVTDTASLREAVGTVERELGPGAGLAGLVNNAGVTGGMPVEFTPLDELQHLLAVNIIGVIALTQAFLPLIRRGRGRIVVIGSISGRFAVPFLAAYSLSKSAVSSLCDSLRGELRPWGIEVTLVEPGSIKTAMWDKGLSDLDRWPSDAVELYGDAIHRVRVLTGFTVSRAIPPERVARVVERALTARRPRTRYLVGGYARVRAAISRIPDRPRDRLVALALNVPKKA